MEFALRSEIYCFIHLHSLLRIVFVHNIYYIFAKLSLANIRPQFSNKPIVHSRHRGRYTQKFKNNHFTFLKNIEKNPSPIVQSNCPVQLSSPTVQSNCPVQLSSPVHVLYYAVSGALKPDCSFFNMALQKAVHVQIQIFCVTVEQELYPRHADEP